MPSDYGYSVIGVVGANVPVFASGFHDVRWKMGAITLDWSKIVALVSPVTLINGTTIPAGAKYVPGGTVLLKELAGSTNPGYFAPYDNTDTHGLQTLDATRIGEAFILPEDVIENPVLGLVSPQATLHPPVFDAATVYKARLQVGGAGQPTWAEFFAAFPGVVPVTL